MHIKRKIKKAAGILFAMVLAASFLLPVQAVSYYKHNSGYLMTHATYSSQKQAVTPGGSAYDDRGNALNAYLGAGVARIGEKDAWSTFRFSGSTTKNAKSGYYKNVVGGLYYCGPENKK